MSEAFEYVGVQPDSNSTQKKKKGLPFQPVNIIHPAIDFVKLIFNS